MLLPAMTLIAMVGLPTTVVVDKKFDNTWFVYDRSNAPLTDAGERAVLKWSRAQQSEHVFGNG